METKQFIFNKIIKDRLPETGLYYYSFLDIQTKINTGKTEKKYGKYFFINMNSPYAHFVIDGIGGYLQVKKYINDLKPVFIINNRVVNYFNQKANHEMAKNFNGEIIDITKTDVWFENAIIPHRHVSVIPFQDFFENLDYEPEENYTYLANNPLGTFEWTVNAAKELSLFFNKNIKTLDKNIYISRSKSNKLYIENRDGYDKKDRIHSSIFDDSFDQIMSSIGYDVIFAEDLSFNEQFLICSAAKNFITIDGASLINSIWTHENANIVNLRVLPEYSYFWKEFIEATGRKMKTVEFFNSSNLEILRKYIEEITI